MSYSNNQQFNMGTSNSYNNQQDDPFAGLSIGTGNQSSMNMNMGMGGLDMNFNTNNQYSNVNSNNKKNKQEVNDFDLIWHVIMARSKI